MRRMIKLARISLIVPAFFSANLLTAAGLPAAVFSRLGSEQFAERERAQDELLEWCRKQPAPPVDELYKQTRILKDPEIRERCRSVLKELVTDELLKNGQGYIGVALLDDFANVPGDPNPRNVVRISLVEPGSPGDKAGIRANDVILAVDKDSGPAVRSYLKFQEEIRARKPDSKVKLRILRGAETLELEVRLGRRLLMPENFFPDGRNFDPEALDLAEKDAHFRRWMDQKKLAE
ncbi:MAG: PDZ domain-containing protein [Verrucomicrobiaceae bacterium]|nr:MAG: PDZ domain-containing protein [Verrucomicrobiaceae bacterium]